MADTSKPRQKLSRKAWEEGRTAREAGKTREECPYSMDQGPQSRAWEGGWDSLGPLTNVHVAVPVGVRVRVEATISTARPVSHFVPDGVDILPMLKYWRARLTPCPQCRRMKLDSGSQACVNNGEHQGVVSMRCRSCGHSFKVTAG